MPTRLTPQTKSAPPRAGEKSISANGGMSQLGRNPTGLVRAYEAGEDRQHLERSALAERTTRTDYRCSGPGETAISGRTGGPLEVKALTRELKPSGVATWFGGADPRKTVEGPTVIIWSWCYLMKAVLMRAHHDFGMPEDRRWCLDLIFFPARRV